MKVDKLSKPIIKVKNIKKTFGGIKALEGVSIDFYPGEVHCIVGENGAGKSTLVKIIAGTYIKDEGEINYFGKNVEPKNMWDMFQQGISIIFQEPGLIESLTVAENIFLNRENQFLKMGILSISERNKFAEKALKEIGIENIDVTKKVTTLPYEIWKLIELSRAVSNKNLKVLIVDESTAALSISGQKILFQQIDKLKRKDIAILYISHRLNEVFEIGDRITVMKDAKIVKTLLVSETNVKDLSRMMVGREIKDYYRTDVEENYSSEVFLSVENVNIKGQVKNINFNLHSGEILGIGGLVGSGMHILGRALFGLVPHKGEIRFKNNKLEQLNPVNSIKMGMAYVPRERDKEGLILMHSVKDNISLPNMDQVTKKYKTNFFISHSIKSKIAEKYKKELDIRVSDINYLCSTLSGGNRQKVVLAKWLARNTDIFIFVCPTRGIDVGAKAQIYRLMEKLKSQGKAILMISEELPELIGMSDNIMIFKGGEIVKTFKRSEQPSEEEIVANMV
jgi:ABC-type sugar transport system ATPase subunit